MKDGDKLLLELRLERLDQAVREREKQARRLLFSIRGK